MSGGQIWVTSSSLTPSKELNKHAVDAIDDSTKGEITLQSIANEGPFYKCFPKPTTNIIASAMDKIYVINSKSSNEVEEFLDKDLVAQIIHWDVSDGSHINEPDPKHLRSLQRMFKAKAVQICHENNIRPCDNIDLEE